MKKIEELTFGFNDAVNYKKPENKELFQKFFYRTEEYSQIFNGSKYFIIGDKGTGKTAYATFLVNQEQNGFKGFIKLIGSTDYPKFIKLKNDNHLQLSDYTNIWKVLIYLLLAEYIPESEKSHSIFNVSDQFEALKKAINEYYLNAFSPEIINALNFVEKSKFSAEIIAKYFSALGEKVNEKSFTHSRFQTNLLYISNHFEKAFSSIKLKRNYILFVDGIDIRPDNVPYSDYLDCIKGLASATWELNNEYFPTIKSDGKIKVMLLIRPDIFANLGLQNINNKIKDNSILLEWRTSYPEYRNSKIFQLSDRLLSSQQEENTVIGQCWDTYFPYQPYVAKKFEPSFIQFLRFSLYRPRDIVTMLDYLREIHIRTQNSNPYVFCESDFLNTEFQEKYSNYLMGEIKDYLAFYYSDSDYEHFRKFFDFLNGRKEFSYDHYLQAFNKIEEYFVKNNIDKPKFFESAEIFLQFLFELNVICYIEQSEKGNFIRWCFRERNYSNIQPKVKSGCRYSIHYGLLKSLNFGRDFRAKKNTHNKQYSKWRGKK